jgi:hypothetical protein
MSTEETEEVEDDLGMSLALLCRIEGASAGSKTGLWSAEDGELAVSCSEEIIEAA